MAATRTTSLVTPSGARVKYVMVPAARGQFAPALEVPGGVRVWITVGGGEAKKPSPVPKPAATKRIEAHREAGYWRTAANPARSTQSLLVPGMHVRELGRAEGGGVVEKVRPEGMVVVRERDGYTRQRHESVLVPVAPARRNPKSTLPATKAIGVNQQYLQRNVLGVLRTRTEGTPRERLSAAFRIVLGRLQKYGYVRKGTTQLTEKGKEQARILAAEPDHFEKLAEYEEILLGARKSGVPREVTYLEQRQAAKKRSTSMKRKHKPSVSKRAAGKRAAAARKRGPTGAFIKGNPRGTRANPVARGFAVTRANGPSPTAALVEKMRRKGSLRAASEGGVEMVALPEHGLVMAILSSDHLRYLKQSLPKLAKDWIVEERTVERRVDPETLREYTARGMRVILAEIDSPGVRLLADHAFPQEGVAAIKGIIYRDKRTNRYRVGGMGQNFGTVAAAAEARDLLLRRGAHFGGRWSSGGRA